LIALLFIPPEQLSSTVPLTRPDGAAPVHTKTNLFKFSMIPCSGMLSLDFNARTVLPTRVEIERRVLRIQWIRNQ
jgi:hypothetical protein